MSELLDDYTKAAFPLEVAWPPNNLKVRLFAAFGDRVVGASYGTYERDGETVEWLGQVLDWDGQGKFGTSGATYPHMDLPPPPARQAETIAVWEQEIAAAEARLSSAPDAPQEWRVIDERRITDLRKNIARLTGGAS